MGRWKLFEREVAKILSGRRRPVTGIDRADGDAFTNRFEVQCKYRMTEPPPKRVLDWLDGIRKTAAARDRVGVVVWKRPFVLDPRESLVVMTLGDFARLVAELEQEQPPTSYAEGRLGDGTICEEATK